MRPTSGRVLLSVRRFPLGYVDSQSLRLKEGRTQLGWRGYFLPLVSPTWKSEPGDASKVRACTGGGSLEQPSLKILDKNANPEGKERTTKESVNHRAPAPHPQTQLYRPHSSRGQKWGDQAGGKEERKGRARPPPRARAARGAGGGGGARPGAEQSGPQLGERPGGGGPPRHPLSRGR